MDNDYGLGAKLLPSDGRYFARIVMAMLSRIEAPRPIVRITGGCANMTYAEGEGILDLFDEAFAGFKGALLFGGTRMILDRDPTKVLMGITEVGPRIRKSNPDCIAIGIIPRTEGFELVPDIGAFVLHKSDVCEVPENDGFMTIAHPYFVDVIQHIGINLTNIDEWHDEAQFCTENIDMLRGPGEWISTLVAYNGGKTTEYEIRAVAQRGWPVILVAGSGRKTDELANDESFLAEHPSVLVCDKTAQSLRDALIRTSAIQGRIRNHLKLAR